MYSAECKNITRYAAEELAREKGLEETWRYRNAGLLCEKAHGREWPYEENIDLSNALEALQRVLRELFDLGEIDHPFESVAYSRAARIAAEFHEPIHNAQQLNGVEGIGRGIKRTIREWLYTGEIEQLNELTEQLDRVKEGYGD